MNKKDFFNINLLFSFIPLIFFLRSNKTNVVNDSKAKIVHVSTFSIFINNDKKIIETMKSYFIKFKFFKDIYLNSFHSRFLNYSCRFYNHNYYNYKKSKDIFISWDLKKNSTKHLQKSK